MDDWDWTEFIAVSVGRQEVCSVFGPLVKRDTFSWASGATCTRKRGGRTKCSHPRHPCRAFAAYMHTCTRALRIVSSAVFATHLAPEKRVSRGRRGAYARRVRAATATHRQYGMYQLTHRGNVEKGNVRVRHDVRKRLHIGVLSPAKQDDPPLREVGGAVVAHGLRLPPGGDEASRRSTCLWLFGERIGLVWRQPIEGWCSLRSTKENKQQRSAGADLLTRRTRS